MLGLRETRIGASKMGSTSSASTSDKFSSFLVATVKLSCTSCIGSIGAKFSGTDTTGGCMNPGHNSRQGASQQDRKNILEDFKIPPPSSK